MLIIHNGAEVEPLTDYKDLTIRERVNGEHSLFFLLLATDENYHLVNEENIVEYNGQEYRIKKILEQSKGEKSIKSVQAQHVFFDLINEYKYELIGGDYTLTQLLQFALVNTDFTFNVEGLTNKKLVFNYGEGNVIKLIQSACDLWGAEWELTNRHITFKQQIGEVTDHQFRYKHNLKTIKKDVDTSKLATKIRGYGKGFSIDYTSPMADIYGIRHTEPIRNDDITDNAVMLDLLKRTLNDKPNLSITIELAQLEFDVKKGDEIVLIYEPLNIEMTARITELEYYPKTPKSSKVTISNYNETMSDVMMLLAKNIGEVDKKSEINRSQIRQTDERISLEVERIDEDLTESRSLIEQNANEIILKVSKDNVISSINQTAEAIQIQASKINLVGAVTVLSDISGNLGTITAGIINGIQINGGSIASNTTINVGTNATIGNKLILSGEVNRREITFSSGARITTPSSTSLYISASTIQLDNAQILGSCTVGGHPVLTTNSNVIAKFG